MKKIIFASLCLTALSCTSVAKNTVGITGGSVGGGVGVGTNTTATKRTPASNDLRVDLSQVAALLKGYFSAPGDKKGETKIQGYSAYVLNAEEGKDYGRVVIYVDNQNDLMGKQILAVDNANFISTGGPMAGDEPSFSTNRKDSLLIQTGNDGGGRTAWHETVTVAWRGGQLVVAGYDYSDYDRLGQDNETNCSVNLLTGKGILTTYPPREANPDGKAKVTKFSFPVVATPLNDWKESSKPKGCGLQ